MPRLSTAAYFLMAFAAFAAMTLLYRSVLDKLKPKVVVVRQDRSLFETAEISPEPTMTTIDVGVSTNSAVGESTTTISKAIDDEDSDIFAQDDGSKHTRTGTHIITEIVTMPPTAAKELPLANKTKTVFDVNDELRQERQQFQLRELAAEQALKSSGTDKLNLLGLQAAAEVRKWLKQKQLELAIDSVAAQQVTMTRLKKIRAAIRERQVALTKSNLKLEEFKSQKRENNNGDLVPKYQVPKAEYTCTRVKVGAATSNAGWVVPKSLFIIAPDRAVIYSFGVGKDISFDAALFDMFDLYNKKIVLHAFDPDPRTRTWLGAQRPISGFAFHDYALGKADGPIEFYQLYGRSGTVVDNHLSKTKDQDVRVKAKAKTIKTILHELQHKSLSLVKMDIEAYEYEVFNMLTMDDLPSPILLLEFHTNFADLVEDSRKKTEEAVNFLVTTGGWRIFHVDQRSGRKFTFIRTCPSKTANVPSCYCCKPEIAYICMLHQ